MKKYILILAALLVVFGSIWGFWHQGESEKPDQKPVFKIGAVFPLSGATSKEGNELKNAMLYMLRQYQDSPVQYELIFEDSVGGSAAKGISAIKKLIYVDKVRAVTSIFSAVAQAIAPIAEQEKVVQIAIVSELDSSKSKLNFTIYSDPAADAQKLAELLQKQKFKKAACFVQVMAAQQARFAAFAKAAEQKGIEVREYKVMSGVRNFQMEIAEAAKWRPDVIVMLTAMPELDIVATQIKEQQLNVPITSIEGISFSAMKKELFEGSVYVEGQNGDRGIIEHIREQIKAQGTTGFVFAYNFLNIITHIVDQFYQQNQRLPKGDELADLLRKVKEFPGVAGKINLKDNKFSSASGLSKIINGKIVAIE